MLSKKQPIVVESQFPFYVGSSSFRRRKTNRPKPCLLLLQHTSKASASQLQPPDTETPIYVGGTESWSWALTSHPPFHNHWLWQNTLSASECRLGESVKTSCAPQDISWGEAVTGKIRLFERYLPTYTKKSLWVFIIPS